MRVNDNVFALAVWLLCCELVFGFIVGVNALSLWLGW